MSNTIGVVKKNVLTPIVSFRIEQIEQIWLSPKIYGTQKVPPDFDEVSQWIVINKGADGKFSVQPNKLVTDLIVVADKNGDILGYLNKLFNFTYVINLEFELAESIDIAEKEISINLWIIYQEHAEKDLTVHPKFLERVASIEKLNIIQQEYEQYIQDFELNPILKDSESSSGEYLFDNYSRSKPNTISAIKAVSFPSIADLSQKTGLSFSGMRIGFNFLEGFYLFKIIGAYILLITPRSRQRTTCNCYILKADRILNPLSRVFTFAGNYYLVSNNSLLILCGTPRIPETVSGYSLYDYSGSTETRELLQNAVAFEFSHLGDLVINKDTESMYSVMYEKDSESFNEYYSKYLKDSAIDRIKAMYKCAYDNWVVNYKLSSEVLLSNRWCLFKHKASEKILATSNYPIKNSKNRRVFDVPQVNFPTIDNDFMILRDKNKYINLKNNITQDLQYIDMYLGNRLIIVGGQFVIC